MFGLKVTIIGASPTGFFVQQVLKNLQRDDLQLSIYMIERLATPRGLVRNGVTPDHTKIKTVAKVSKKIEIAEDFCLFGNSEVGTDVSIEQLNEIYGAKVIIVGSAVVKKYGIPSEDLTGSVSVRRDANEVRS